jgi:hypothetical protein
VALSNELSLQWATIFAGDRVHLRVDKLRVGAADQSSPMSGISVICTVLALKSRTPAAENTRSNYSANLTGCMGLGGRIGFGGNARSLPTATNRKDGTTKRTVSVGTKTPLLCPAPKAM